MTSKFCRKSAQKWLILSSKASYARSLKEWLAAGWNSCPHDRIISSEEELTERPDLYQKMQCRVTAFFFTTCGGYTTINRIIGIDSTIFSTLEKIDQKFRDLYVEDDPHERLPAIERMTLGLSPFDPRHTLAHYHYLPGDTIQLRIYFS